MEVVVRDAVVADAPDIAAVHVAGWRWAYDGLMPAPLLAGLSVAGRSEGWARLLGDAAPYSVNLVAEADGSVVGFVSLGKDRETAESHVGELMAVYVTSAAAGTGVGARLHDEGLSRLTAHGFREARLWVLASNERARHFYERHGWEPDGETKDQELSDGFMAHEVRYRRALP